MGLFDAIFGRTKLPPGKTDQIFALTTATVDIEVKLNSPYGNRAALVLRSVDNSSYDALTREINDLLSMSGRDFTADVRSQTDSMGFHWLMFEGPNLDDAINGLFMAADLLKQSGYMDSLLAAMFRFGDWYLIYSYRRATFYPFVPVGSSQRNESREFRIRNTLVNALPIEKDPERWYPLWDPPI